MAKITIEFKDAEDIAMAVPLLLALSLCPAILGAQEGIRQSQGQQRREEHRSRRCNLMVSCIKPSIRKREIDGTLIMLKNGKLHLATLDSRDGDAQSPSSGSGHLFSGYYLPYPDSGYEGLVSTISNDPPMLNWIYVDKDTHEVKYGERSVAQEHVTGPFDCTSQDRRLTLEGWEGFAAVEEPSGVWTLYFDRDDDGLATKVPLGTRVLEVELDRREKKEPKPSSDEPPAQTGDDKERAQLRASDDEVAGSASHGHLGTAVDHGGSMTESIHVNSLPDEEEARRLAHDRVRPGETDDLNNLLDASSTTAGVELQRTVGEKDSRDAAHLKKEGTIPAHDSLLAEDVIREEKRTVYETPYVEDEDKLA